MVANSEVSMKQEKRNTGKTEKLTREQALEILQQALIHCQHTGLSVRVAPFYEESKPVQVVIVLANVEIRAGNLVFIEEVNDEDWNAVV